MEAKKILPNIQFYLSFGVLPSHPEASQKVYKKIDYMVRYAYGMEGFVEYIEERNTIWNNIFNLIAVAQKSGHFKNKE